MKFTVGLFITLDNVPNDRKLSKDEKVIAKESFLTKYKPKPEMLYDDDDDHGWYVPLNNSMTVEAHFAKPRYPTSAEIVEVELKARELFPDEFN